MSRIGKVLLGFNAFIDGEGYIGLASKFEPSSPVPKTKTVSSPGLAGEIDRNISKWEKSQPKLTLSDYIPSVIAMVGNPTSVGKVLTLIGAVGEGANLKTVEYKITGEWIKEEAAEWADEADAEIAFTISAQTWQMSIDGKEVKYIDYIKNEVRLNGVSINDQLKAAIRA